MTDTSPDSSVDRVTAKMGHLDTAEKSGNISDEIQEYDQDQTQQSATEDSDEDNEFLNSSSFISNSQIIRTTNVASFKPAEQSAFASPVRRAKDHTQSAPSSTEVQSSPSSTRSTKNKTHFKILANKRSNRRLKLEEGSHSDDYTHGDDYDDDLEKDTSGSEDHKSTKFIDIDDPRSTPKLPKMHPDSTPWRHLRPQSTIRVRETEPTLPKPDVTSIHYVQSLFDSNFDSLTATSTASTGKSPTRSVSLFESTSGVSENGSTTANMSHELENLRKQVTNYKLHQRVLMELIRNLVTSSGMKSEDLKKDIMDKLEKENEFLISERQSLQKELSSKQPVVATAEFEEKYNEKVKVILELKNDLIAAKNLSVELTSYVDELKEQLSKQQHSAGDNDLNVTRWMDLLNSILSILLRMIHGESAKAVQQARDSSKSLDTKLNVVKLALNEVMNNLQNTQSQVLQEKMNTENIPPDGLGPLNDQFQDKLNSSRRVEQELRALLRQQSDLVSTLRSEYTSLQKQFKDNLQATQNLKTLLAERRAKVTELTEKLLELEAQNEVLEDSKDSEHQDEEAKLLKSRLSIVKVNHSKEIDTLHTEIENLHMQLEEQSRRADDKKLMDELARKQKYVNDLNDEIASLNSRLLNSNRDHEAELVKIKSLLQDSRDDCEGLVREYNSLQQEFKEIQVDRLSKEKDYRRKLEHAAKELNLAVTKQRALAAEKSKLKYALEECKRERNSLKANNSTLNEKISRLTYEVSSLANFELGFKSFFDLQFHHIKNMLQDFEPLLEMSSYTQAQQKLEKLSDSSLDIEMTHSVVRSLFAFFENATGSLISDHKDLMMGAGDQDLRAQVDELQNQLQWYQDKYSKDTEDEDSPRTKLRIVDLQRKFKAERERRRVEFDQSQKVASKLEKENRELKEELERLRASQIQP